MAIDECIELTDQLARPAKAQIGFDAVFDSSDPELLEPVDLRLSELVVAEVLQGIAAP